MSRQSVTLTDALGNTLLTSQSSIPVSYVIPTAGVWSSGVVGNATATATIPAVAGKTAYIAGYAISGEGASAVSNVTFTITGLAGAGGGTYNAQINAPGVVTTGMSVGPLNVSFNPPLPASAVNTAIVSSLPALGSGNVTAIGSANAC